MGKKSKKQAKDEAALKKAQAHFSGFTNNNRKEGELSDLSDDEAGVPHTPATDPAQPPSTHKVQGSQPPPPNVSPWMRRSKCFEGALEFSEVDLALKQIPYLNTSTAILELDRSDHVPIHQSWGICMLGIFARRFPGKQAVYNLMQHWRH